MQKLNILSGFWLKIIAIVAMTIDHLGLILAYYYLSDSDALIVTMRSIGRLALPLYAFFIAEGVFYTKSFLKYFLRLFTMAVAISIALVVINETNLLGGNMVSDAGNIFLDLTLGAVGAYCLKNKRIYIKFLAILPLLYGVASYAVQAYEIKEGAIIHWLPYFLRTQYGWYGIALMIGFYLVRIIADIFLQFYSEKSGMLYENIKGSEIEYNAIKLLNVVIFFSITAILIIVLDMYPANIVDQQIFCLFAGALILLYNSKRGYNRKWFEYGCYLYYPVHIIILGLIFYLLNL